MRPSIRTLFAILALAAAIGISGPAAADLIITPKRLVLDSATNDAVFRLVNSSSGRRTYELVWTQLRMDAGGRLVDAGDDAPGGVAGLLRVAPTRVTLEPGERQTIRLLVRPPDNLPEGEYMSHLSFRPTGGVDDAPSSGVSEVRLQARVGFSVPVIFRHGRLTSSVSVQPTEIDLAGGIVNVDVAREGMASVFGRVEIYWGKPGAAGTRVGFLDGFAVYANVSRLLATVPLSPPEGVVIGPGLLMVRYVDPNNNEVLAETVVRLE